MRDNMIIMILTVQSCCCCCLLLLRKQLEQVSRVLVNVAPGCPHLY